MRNLKRLAAIRKLPCVVCGQSPSQAAQAALPYVHGKVAEKGKKETKEDAAKAATKSGKFGTLNNQLPS